MRPERDYLPDFEEITSIYTQVGAEKAVCILLRLVLMYKFRFDPTLAQMNAETTVRLINDMEYDLSADDYKLLSAAIYMRTGGRCCDAVGDYEKIFANWPEKELEGLQYLAREIIRYSEWSLEASDHPATVLFQMSNSLSDKYGKMTGVKRAADVFEVSPKGSAFDIWKIATENEKDILYGSHLSQRITDLLCVIRGDYRCRTVTLPGREHYDQNGYEEIKKQLDRNKGKQVAKPALVLDLGSQDAKSVYSACVMTANHYMQSWGDSYSRLVLIVPDIFLYGGRLLPMFDAQGFHADRQSSMVKMRDRIISRGELKAVIAVPAMHYFQRTAENIVIIEPRGAADASGKKSGRIAFADLTKKGLGIFRGSYSEYLTEFGEQIIRTIAEGKESPATEGLIKYIDTDAIAEYYEEDPDATYSLTVAKLSSIYERTKTGETEKITPSIDIYQIQAVSSERSEFENDETIVKIRQLREANERLLEEIVQS